MAARPGRVMADLAVEAPYPRDGLFRTSPEYATALPDRIRSAVASDCRMSELVEATARICHDGTDAEARPVFAQERRVLGLPASTWPGILAPIGVGVLILCCVGGDGPHQGHSALHPAGPAADRRKR